MNYEPQDFARCNGNPCFTYCTQCKRNIKNYPLPSDATHSVWLGPWVFEDERCPSYLDNQRFYPAEHHAKTTNEASVPSLQSLDGGG